MKHLLPTAAVAAALLTCMPPPARALWDEKVELFAAQSITQDENLFRLGTSVDPLPILGVADIGDRYLTTTAGVRFDVPVGAQRFIGNLSRSEEQYERFTRLDFDGHSVDTSWLWQFGRRLDGRLRYRNDLILGSFANLQGGIQSRNPNLIQIRRKSAETGLQIAPRWEVRGSLANRQHRNSAPEFQVSNADIDEAELILNFVSRSGNRLGLSAQATEAILPQPQLIGGVLVDNSFDQQTVSLVLDWSITELSRWNIRLGQVSRSYAQSAERDYSDWVLSAAYEWRPTTSFSLTALAERDISATEEVNVGFVFVERFILRPAWRVSDKIELSANFEHGNRQYLGDPGLQSIQDERVGEQVNVAGVTLAWEPARMLRLSMSWRHEDRDASLSFANYDTEIVTFELQLAF